MTLPKDLDERRRLIQENIEAVKQYDFSGLSLVPISTRPCPRCDGRGYKRQVPGEYGLCPCTSCGGSGKMATLRVK